MAVNHSRSQTKKSGGRTPSSRKVRKHELGNQFTQPELGDEEETDSRKGRGQTEKHNVVRAKKVNLSNDGKVEKVEINRVVSNDANPNYVRRSLLTKGTVVETEKGKARITSRPGQEGVVNAVLIEE